GRSLLRLEAARLPPKMRLKKPVKLEKAAGRLRNFPAADRMGGKGAMEGAGRLERRPGTSKQEVCERRAKPRIAESQYDCA
ncbi:MAG: hypothetical protein FWH38_09735, partial [Treponema sp.]|nr:hypothetical protein [Treponema sp.]